MENQQVKKWELLVFILIVIFSGAYLFSKALEPTFKETIDSKIIASIATPNGDLIVTGNFSYGFAYRITPNLEVDWKFQKDNTSGGFNSAPTALARAIDGDYIFAGGFTNYDQSIVGYIVKLDQWGNINNSFVVNSGVGFNDLVYDVKALNDGDLLVAGAFTNYNGTDVPGVARLNPDGTLDETFKGPDIKGIVKTIHINTDSDQYLIGGDFYVEGSKIKNLARLDSLGQLAH